MAAKQKLGAGFSAAAVLTVAVHTLFPPAHEHSRAAAAPAAREAKAETAKNEKRDSAEQETKDAETFNRRPVEGPWLATRDFFLATPFSRNAPDLGSAPRAELRKLLALPDEDKYQVFAIVATVANPVHTRMPLLFDEQLEAIVTAATRQQWEFSRQWLPWNLRPASDGKLKDQLEERALERRQESMPGVLVFRHVPDGGFEHKSLLVFLVPETPTAGISAEPFRVAMNLALAAAPAGRNVGLLAPSFSGSFESLTRLVKPFTQHVSRQVFSGNVSGDSYAKAFESDTGLEFHGGVASNRAYQDVFKKVLARYGIDPERAAYLIESESGYADSFVGAEAKVAHKHSDIWVYRFPREISSLRNAYQEAQAASTQESITSGGEPQVEFTFKDRSHGEDGVPLFADTHTPIVQSAALGEITSDLRGRGIKLVYIAATNVLDSLFLARLVREGSPGTRVLVGDGDTIFVPAAAREPIKGTLFLSTFPISMQGDRWTSDNVSHIRAFPSATFQATYNVTQMLLLDLKATKPGHLDLPGFEHFPLGGTEYPGLWLLSLTRKGLAPLDWFENDIDGKEDKVSSWFKVINDDEQRRLAAGDETIGEKPDDRFIFPSPPVGWYLTLAGLTTGILLVSVTIWAANRRPSDSAARPAAWFSISLKSPASALALLVSLLSMALLELVVVLPYWSQLTDPDIYTFAVGLGSVAGVSVPLFVAVVVFRRLQSAWNNTAGNVPVSASLKSLFTTGDYFVSLAAIGVMSLLGLTWASACYDWQHAPQTAILFAYRAQDLFSGASPSLPYLLFGLAFFAGSIILFRRYSEVAWNAPLLHHRNRSDAKLHNMINSHVHAVELLLKEETKLDVRLATPLKWRFTVSGVLVVLCLLPLASSLRAFEVGAYSVTLQCAVALMLFVLAAACYDVVYLWTNLRTLLQLLENSPLRQAFTRVVRTWPKQPVWALWRAMTREGVETQMLLALHGRSQAAHQVHTRVLWFREYESFRDKLRNSAPAGARAATAGAGGGSGGGPFTASAAAPQPVQSPIDHEAECARIAESILIGELTHHWETNVSQGHEGEASAEYAADFVALQFCKYILFVVHQVQRVSWSISSCFLLLVVALVSYTSQAPHFLARAIAVLFILLSAIIAWVFVGMERNWVLSKISHSKPGELSGEFWVRLVAVVILPLCGVLVNLFPSLGTVLTSIIEPSMEALK